MKRLLVTALLALLAFQVVWPASAAEFPESLEFLNKLRVIFRGECVVDEQNKIFIPCHIRVSNLNSGQELFYIVIYQDDGKLYGIDSFRITGEKVILAAPMSE